MNFSVRPPSPPIPWPRRRSRGRLAGELDADALEDPAETSGAMAGLAGAVLLAHASSFTGTGDTMVNGRGWIGIVAYLFGNYNPLGAAAAAVLFGGWTCSRFSSRRPASNYRTGWSIYSPYAAVIVVLTVWGSTRMPFAVGESYESEE